MSARHRLAIIGLVSLSACSPTSATPLLEEGIAFRTDTSMHAYIGDPATEMDSSFTSWYYESLPDVGEPPLRGATLPSSQRVFRFTWVRSFHPMIVIRLMQSPSGCRMVVTEARSRMLDISGIPLIVLGDTAEIPPAPPTPVVPAKSTRRDSSVVPASVCTALATTLDGIGLTREPVLHHGGVDGAAWFLERVDVRGHAMALYHSPDRVQEKAIFDAGMAFLREARMLPANEHEIY